MKKSNTQLLNSINNAELGDNIAPFGSSEETIRIPSPRIINAVIDAIEGVMKYPPF